MTNNMNDASHNIRAGGRFKRPWSTTKEVKSSETPTNVLTPTNVVTPTNAVTFCIVVVITFVGVTFL